VEFLVVALVLIILTAITLPAVTQSRAAAARTHCASNLRNIAIALIAETDRLKRYPACGNFGQDPSTGVTKEHHNWVVDVLPWLDHAEISDQWERNQPRYVASNLALAEGYLAILTCPVDVSISPRTSQRRGDLSYVVNGGIGFTHEISSGVHDCPVDWRYRHLDLNANGTFCPPDDTTDGSPSDRNLFKAMGVFFNESWGWDVSRRHHTTASIVDGLSQTMLASENVRTGYDPTRPDANWSSSFPLHTSFYIGNPCGSAPCTAGSVDYARSNSGENAINSGLTRPEGESPVPNSFHRAGVNMAFCDGRVVFLNETIEGAVYAALASPDGDLLASTPLAQPTVQAPE